MRESRVWTGSEKTRWKAGMAGLAGGEDWRGGQLCHDCVLAEDASCTTL